MLLFERYIAVFRKIATYHDEQDDNLALCPISHAIALALADHVFRAREILLIFWIEVPNNRNGLELRVTRRSLVDPQKS